MDTNHPNYSTTFVISSPSGSGKTSMLQYLYENHLFLEKEEGIYYYAALNRSVDPWTKLYAFCDQNFNLSEKFANYQKVILLLDDAQNSYGFTGFWEGFRNASLPKKLKLIVSTTFSHTIGLSSPAALSSVHKPSRLDREDMLLSLEDSKTLIADSLQGPQWTDCQSLIDVMARDCGGLAGALQVATSQMHIWGRTKDNFSVEEAIDAYLSIFNDIDRCYGNLDDFLEGIKETILQSELQGLGEGSEMSKLMFKAGLIESPKELKFTSPLAKRYIFKKCFPSRSMNNPSSLIDLIKLSIMSMSSSLLRASTITGALPKEAVFQHLFMTALAANTKIGTYICPELSQIFPVVGEDNEELARIQGEVDFFVDGKLRWGIELLVHGRKITEHISRFKEGGKYAQLKCKDDVVVDFRAGMPTSVTLHPNRVSVFFPSQDYATCIIVYGKDGLQEQLMLQR